ncbi:hypothetical protein [Tepidibacillus marianensis]|uniref:hypothetical protein n=1 Tax=Tepidibacillus marianensis TaxID=3131995 RepID=UPI0030CDC52C
MNSISTGQKTSLEIELQLKGFNEVKSWLLFGPTDRINHEEELPNFRMKDNLFE